MRPHRGLARLAALALLASLGLSGTVGHAEDDASSPWLSRATYEDLGQLVSGKTSFGVWRKAKTDGEAGADAPLITLLRSEDDVVREAYDIALDPEAGGGVLFTMRRRSEPDEASGTRIVEAGNPPEVIDLAFAQHLVGQLLEAEPRWLAGAQRLEEAELAQRNPDDESARGLLRDAIRTLERVHQTAPWHLGVVSDLLAAYQLLLPYEVGTDRGANISFLWREVCTQWLSGGPTGEEQATGIRCQLTCAFAEGCYPLAASLTQHPLLHDGEDLEPIRRALLELGQTEHEVGEREQLAGPRGSTDLVAITCPAEPPDTALPWHRRVYLTYRPGFEGPPLPVWFSLSLEGESGARRWALVGWVGSSRRVLRLFGAKVPAVSEVDAFVRGLIQHTADAEAPR